MMWLAILLVALAEGRKRVLDVPLLPGGAGTICGDLTCSYCCLEGFVCANFMPECAYISTDRETENLIFIGFGAFLIAWASIWFSSEVYGYMRRRRRMKN